MRPIVHHTCVECGAAFIDHADKTPPGWERAPQGLVCADCLTGEDRQSELPIEPSDDRHARTETAIALLSGSYLDLADPDCSVIHPIDVAAGLRQPCFCAQTRQFYTIAQHSMLVLRLISPIARHLGGEKGQQLRRCALMHDAAEAFLHDITRPLKIQLPDYRAIEARFELRLADHFGWSWTDFRRETVKRADLQALAIEQRDLVGSTDDWPILDSIDRTELRSIQITRCWQPDEAQERFLFAFEDLFPTEERMAA
ncbi:hydrolase of hd superfamily [Qipengyuania citrea LAMA 915]|uniref:Hydrolase of hd superfamily n=1 Tax=Qipengyuania citrea LAMA 915 TaxID=1306953 RepID=A0A0L1KFJ0_9SPHN|nr:hypothetical protein [Qipengyuania citrea]KNH02639.1 hydrolase of hd superfamily [Qipengyuania citrea LAMA 915]